MASSRTPSGLRSAGSIASSTRSRGWLRYGESKYMHELASRVLVIECDECFECDKTVFTAFFRSREEVLSVQFLLVVLLVVLNLFLSLRRRRPEHDWLPCLLLHRLHSPLP